MRVGDYNKIKHLEFIQAAINRMAVNSFILKGWSVTIVSAIIAFSISKSNLNQLTLALIPALIFWGLDAYYLKQERLFRKLYDHVRLNKLDKRELYSMNTEKFTNHMQGWVRTLISHSVMPVHSSLILILICLKYIIGGV